MRRSYSLMRRLTMGFQHRLDDELRGKKVTSAQLRFLYELRQRPGSTGAQLARACFMTPQSAQAMMVRAVAQGWVTRGKDPENDRLRIARLTPAGERLMAYASAVFSELEAQVWHGVRMADLRAMNDVLERSLTRL